MGLRGTDAKLYDSVSRFAHPSLTAIAQQASMRADPAGGSFNRLHYRAEPWAVDWQARTACCALIAAATLVDEYYGLSQGPIARWQDEAAAVTPWWFPPEPVGGALRSSNQ